jgi:hypothetical protein
VSKGRRRKLGRDGLEQDLHLGARVQGKEKVRKMEPMN